MKEGQTISATKYFNPILPARLDWPSAIGNFLINFGMLEYLVFVYLKNRLTQDEYSKIREWHFKDRLDRIAQEFNDYPAEHATAFKRLVDRIEELRELRNHIAHGHILCRIDPDTHMPIVTLFKAKDVDMAYSSEAKHLPFEELRTALTALTQVIEEFQTLAGFEPAS